MADDLDARLADWDARTRRLADTPAAETARRARRQRSTTRLAKKLAGIGIVAAALLFGMLVYGLLIGPLGIDGLFTAMGLGLVGVVLWLLLSRERTVAASSISAAPPSQVAARTDAWLDRQRRALPAAAAPVLDAISTRLTQLQPQLALSDQRSPVSDELNRLLGQHLPGLVESYTRIPEPQRRKAPADGGQPMEARLVEGLKLVEAELGDVTEGLAAADRDAFLTQGRYLETKYGKEGGG